jgi:hypothetical protein
VRNLSSALKEPPLILSGAGAGQLRGKREAALWRRERSEHGRTPGGFDEPSSPSSVTSCCTHDAGRTHAQPLFPYGWLEHDPGGGRGGRGGGVAVGLQGGVIVAAGHGA